MKETEEALVVAPVTHFMRKIAKTYKGEIVDIMGRVFEEEVDIELDEDICE
jgi:hypothetical protein